MVLISWVGLLAVGYIFYKFLKALGNKLPILELILVIAGMQWIVGAFIEYRTPFAHYKYYMYVDEATYMGFVVPAYIVFAIVLLYFAKKYDDFDFSLDQLGAYNGIALNLLVIGVVADFSGSFVPEQLKFILFLLSNLKYVGAIALFFSPIKWHRNFLYIAVLILIGRSLTSGMFHDFILWSIFFYMFWALQRQTRPRFNLIIIISGFILSTMIQAVKSDYRAMVWGGYSGNKVSLFFDILSAKFSGGLADNPDEQQGLNLRLNQGWIISAVMYNVPSSVPHANGATIKEAVQAALLPRFLNPDKKIAGGVENFEKYTGLQLGKNTSMGISIIGEAYANFGRYGGILFMGVWACFLGMIWGFIVKKINTNTIWIFFLPLIFIQVVKAETELVVVLNHLVKTLIFVFILFWGLSQFTNLQVAHDSED